MRRRDPANLARLIDEAEDVDLPGGGLADQVESQEAADRDEARALAEERPL